MERSARRIEDIRNRMDALRDVQIPTQAFEELETELEEARQSLQQLIDEQQGYFDLGFTEDMLPDTFIQQLDAAGMRVGELEEQMEQLRERGEAFTLGSEGDEYAGLYQQLQQAESEMENLNRQHDIYTQRQEVANQRAAEEVNRTREEQAAEERLNQIRESAIVSNQRIVDLVREREALLRQISEYEDADVAEGYEGYENAVRRLNEVREELSNIRSEEERTRSITDSLGGSFERIAGVAKGSLSKVAEIAKNGISKAFSSIKQKVTKTTQSIKELTKRMLSMLSAVFVFNLISKALQSMVSGLQKGLQNLAQYSSEYNKTMSDFKSATATFSNTLATAFEPVLNTVIPILTKLINTLGIGISYVTQFLAALSGKSTYTKAKKQVVDYAGSLDTAAASADKARKALLGFDELNVLESNDTSSVGGRGSTGSNGADMFEEAPVDNKWADLADDIKKMWEKADFTELGAKLGQKLKNALDSIPWGEIKEKAGKLGKSLATLIGGFVETEGLGYSIGTTLAQAINTAFTFLSEAVNMLPWDSVGKFLAEGCNGLFEGIEWDKIESTFVGGAQGLVELVNTFFSPENFHWDNISTTLANAVNIVVKTIRTLFGEGGIDFKTIGSNLGKQLNETIKKIDFEELGRALADILNSACDFLVGICGELNLEDIINAITDFLKGFLDETDFEDLGTVFMTLLGTVLASKALKTAFGTLISNIVTSIGSSLSLETFISLAGSFLGWVLAAIGAAIAGFNFGKWLGEKLFPEDAEFYSDFSWADVFSSFTDGTWLEAIKLIWEDFKTFVSKKIEEVKLVIESTIAIIATNWKIIWTTIKTVASTVWNAIKTTVSNAINTVKTTISRIINTIKTIWNTVWTSIKTTATNIWNNIKKVVSDAINKVKTTISTVINAIKTTWNTVWTNIKTKVTTIWTGIKTTVSNTISSIKTTITTVLNKIKTVWSTVWNGMKTTVTTVFNNMWSAMKGVINTILGGVESMANGVIKAINSMISRLNSIKVDIPDWSPVGGGTKIGFNLPQFSQVSIPRLATGTVVPPSMSPFLAMLGDNNAETEVVSPLSTMKQAFLEALQENGGVGAMHIYLEGDAAGVFRIVRQENDKQKKRNGGKSVLA